MVRTNCHAMSCDVMRGYLMCIIGYKSIGTSGLSVQLFYPNIVINSRTIHISLNTAISWFRTNQNGFHRVALSIDICGFGIGFVKNRNKKSSSLKAA